MFKAYLQIGLEHILDLQGYDHILFIVTLCAIFFVSQWKQLLILVTAFTVGHCLTLALSALSIININAGIIEFLIPLTILATALYNIFRSGHLNMSVHYMMTLFFGLIHGLGFSNFFKALLGKEESIIQPLLAFNIGVEIGQLIIVAITMAIAWMVMKVGLTQKYWTRTLSIISAVISLYLISNSLAG